MARLGRFDPLELTPDAGVNRVIIGDAAGVDADLIGQRALDLLSAAALEGVAAPDAGRRLAALVATLVAPATAAEQGTTLTRAAALAHWRTIRAIWLGGGVAAGYGPPLAKRARAALAGTTPDAPAIELAANPAVLALVGLARTPGVVDGDIVLDFGHTAVKRAVAVIGARGLSGLRRLPNLEVPPIDVADSGAFVTDVLASTLADHPDREARRTGGLHVSLASYVVGGEPVANWSLYAGLGAGAATMLGARLRRTGIAPARLTIHHDGTAAARAVAGAVPTAVIMMGTSLGVGFAPPLHTLTPVDPACVQTP